MARQIVIWCDPCLAEDVKTPAEDHSVGLVIGAAKTAPTRTIALCEQHIDQLLKPLAALVEAYGVPVDQTPPGAVRGTSGRLEAKSRGPRLPERLAQQGHRQGKPPRKGGRVNDCPWCELTYSEGSGFRRHLKVVHGFEGYQDAFGGPCPVCGEGPFAQILGHCNHAHKELGFTGIAQPFMWARDNGDPHGIYAEIVQRQGSLDPEQAWQETRAYERVVNKEPNTRGN